MRYGVQPQAGRDEREQDDAPAGGPPVQHDVPPGPSDVLPEQGEAPMRYAVQAPERDEREQDDAPAGGPPVLHDAPPGRNDSPMPYGVQGPAAYDA
jgi:hypothetical protein